MANKTSYLRPFTFLFDYPEWGNRMLMGSVLHFIPVLGQIIVQGWGSELMHRRIRGDDTLPTWDDLGAHLKNGVMPFLIGLLAGMPLMVLLMGSAGAAVFAFILAFQAFGVAMGSLVGLLAAALAYAMVWLVGMVFTLPFLIMTLRVDITGKAESAFQLKEVMAMTRALFKEAYIGYIIIWAVAVPVLTVLGYAMCLMGIYPALFLLSLANLEFQTQLYRSWIAKGNAPLSDVSFIDGNTLILGPEL